MKNLNFILLILLFMIFTYSCEQKKKSADSNTEDTEEIDSTVSSDSEFMQFQNTKKMEEINAMIAPDKRVESLRWEKSTDHGSEFVTVTAYLNEDGVPMKIIEHFINGNFRPEGQREYYLEDNNLIFFQEFKDVWIDSNQTEYVETKMVFNNKEEPQMSLTRSADFNDIQDATWKEISKEKPPMEKINHILSGTGRFETHFISVIKANDLFLLLGEAKENDKNRYKTAIRVDEMTPLIEDLLDNLDAYKFRPVDIQFKVVGGKGEAKFRALTAIDWKD